MADTVAASWCLQEGFWPGSHRPSAGPLAPMKAQPPKGCRAVVESQYQVTSLSPSPDWWAANPNRALTAAHTLGLIASVVATLRHMTTTVKRSFCYFSFWGVEAREEERREP